MRATRATTPSRTCSGALVPRKSRRSHQGGDADLSHGDTKLISWSQLSAWLCVLAMLFSTAMLGAHGQTAPSVVRAAPQDGKPRGQEEFDRVCKVCHGAEARGDAGPRLVPFTREYQELLGIVREGIGQMPPIAARQLSDEGVSQVLAYLKFLSR